MKGIIFNNSKIGYRNLPKTASTTIKKAMHLSEGKTPNREETNKTNVHKHYKRVSIDACEFRFVVIRDPIKRFLSAYGNRVTHHSELSEAFIQNKFPDLYWELPYFNPGLGQFIEHFETYLQVPPIRHHLCPITEFFDGEDLSYFTNVYPIENLGKLASDLSDQMDSTIEFGRHQTGGIKYRVRDLSHDQLSELVAFYRQDYKLLADYYSVDDIWRQWHGKTHDVSVPKTNNAFRFRLKKLKNAITRWT